MRLLPILLLTLLSFASCNRSEDPVSDPRSVDNKDKAFLEDIDAARANELIAAESPPVIIDVRTPGEFAAGHIDKAINIDFKSPTFKEELAKLDRDQTYLMHCRSGGRSGQAKPIFEELGFKAVYHLEGGTNAWEEAGLPTVK